MTWTYI